LLKSNDSARAIPALLRTIQIDPAHDEARRKLALELGKQRRFEEARVHFETIVKNNPHDSEDHNNLGVVYASLRRIDNALDEFREAVRLDPRNNSAMRNLRSTQRLMRQPVQGPVTNADQR
jgi:Flp pilus assembly protein TadD